MSLTIGGTHIIDEAHERYTNSDDKYDEESLLEERGEVPEQEYEWREYQKHHKDGDTSSVWCRSTSLLRLVEVGPV
jgi:hypothetical protein